MNKAYLCLGGNLGNCAENFATGMAMLENKGVKTISKSSIYTSQAWGMQNSPDFYNQVIEVLTALSAKQLLSLLLETEKALGRERSAGGEYVSRTMDIDILFFNEEVIEEDTLHIPHPRLHLRRFVLEPLQEIAPELIHPILKKTVQQLINDCTDTGYVKKVLHAL